MCCIRVHNFVCDWTFSSGCRSSWELFLLLSFQFIPQWNRTIADEHQTWIDLMANAEQRQRSDRRSRKHFSIVNCENLIDNDNYGNAMNKTVMQPATNETVSSSSSVERRCLWVRCTFCLQIMLKCIIRKIIVHCNLLQKHQQQKICRKKNWLHRETTHRTIDYGATVFHFNKAVNIAEKRSISTFFFLFSIFFFFSSLHFGHTVWECVCWMCSRNDLDMCV